LLEKEHNPSQVNYEGNSEDYKLMLFDNKSSDFDHEYIDFNAQLNLEIKQMISQENKGSVKKAVIWGPHNIISPNRS